jgi:two-component system, cell cycle sensor histidine kinase and response regulator CckA
MAAKSETPEECARLRARVEELEQRERVQQAEREALIAAHAAASRTLRESELRYRTLVEQAQDGIFLADARGRYLRSNGAFRALLGYSEAELIGKRIRDMVDPVELAQTPLRAEALRVGGRLVSQRKLLRKDGSLVVTEIVSSLLPDGTFEAIVRDVSERMKAEEERAKLAEERRHAQKMESIGRLAGGIAHDFNNLLLVILANANALRKRYGAESAPSVEGIVAAAERGGALTRRLLSFSKKRVFHPTTVDLSDVVRGMQSMLERLMDEQVVLEFAFAEAPCWLLADAGQLEQVIMNLTVNARDACRTGGSVRVQTECDADEVVLRVADSGHGMDESTLARAFEPFFTTKQPVDGSGLGLSMVYGIVTQSGGKVSARSSPGAGSVFEVRMPLAAAASGQAARTERAAGAHAQPRSVGILLVEDDRAVRETLAAVLGDSGYRVFKAGNGMEALDLYAQSRDEIELLISDVVMPALSGPLLAQRLLAERPTLPVLLMSGYSDELFAQGPLDERIGFLQKPFTLDQLVARVCELLD